MLTGLQVLDRYFPEVRAWLIQTAAVLDRYDRAVESEGGPAPDDERWRLLRESLDVLRDEHSDSADRAARIQMIFSDPHHPTPQGKVTLRRDRR